METTKANIEQGPVRFLAWLREQYKARGPMVFSELERAWEETHGYWLPPEMLSAALGEGLDSGEITMDYSQGPFWWIPTGMDCRLCHTPLFSGEVDTHDFCLGKL